MGGMLAWFMDFLYPHSFVMLAHNDSFRCCCVHRSPRFGVHSPRPLLASRAATEIITLTHVACDIPLRCTPSPCLSRLMVTVGHPDFAKL